MPEDKARAAARLVAQLNEDGQVITKDAAKAATERMITLSTKLSGSEDARIEALKHHGLYMGIGTQFMETVAPMAKGMKDDLRELVDEEREAQILIGLWLAKVFIEIEKSLKQYASEHDSEHE